MTKKDKIIRLSKLLREKRGYPDLSYLIKLSDTELTWLLISIIMSKEYHKPITKRKEK